MQYVTISGPVSHMNRAIESYLANHEIHLEYAAEKLSDTPGIQNFSGDNPYTEAAVQVEFFLKFLDNVPEIFFPMTGEDAIKILESAQQRYDRRDNFFKSLEEKRNTILTYLEHLAPFSDMNFQLRDLEDFTTHIHYAFGRMPGRNFQQFENFLYDESEMIFVPASRDKHYVWGGYFSLPLINSPNTSSGTSLELALAPFHFEKIPLKGACMNESPPGTPSEVIIYWQRRLSEIQEQIHKAEAMDEVLGNKGELLAACHTIRELHSLFDIKRYAAKTEGYFYLFQGWMTQEAAKTLAREMRDDEYTIMQAQSDWAEGDVPPTKLTNPPVVSWFEFFVNLYGTPRYNEIDPTPMLAFFYTLLFGIMFGDVGHGLFLALIGYALRQRLGALSGIMTTAGLSAMFFGILYGSIFGLENVFPAIWRHPIEHITDTLMFAVILGVGIIALSMLLNMVNAIRQGDWLRLWLSPSGISGMVFYAGVLALVWSVVQGITIPFWTAGALCVPLVGIAIRPVIAHSQEKESSQTAQTSGGMGMRIFQTGLELFEVLLTYMTNTISFVRVGAFALSHAGMMHVVLMLSQTTAGEPFSATIRNWIVFVAGNLLVIAIEGLLVGIQSLRLGFYEMFSRFYEGGGRAFKPYQYQS